MKCLISFCLLLTCLNSWAADSKFIDRFRAHLAPTASAANCYEQSKCFNMAYDFQDKKSINEAYIYFSKACLLGQPNGCIFAVELKEIVDPLPADQANCFFVHRCFSLGLDYIEKKDRRNALKYFEKSCRLGQPNGCIRANRLKGVCGDMEVCTTLMY